MQNNIFCRRGILGKQRSRRSPLSQNFMKIISHFISVNSVDSSVLGRIILYIFFSVEFFNLGLILSSFDLTIFRRYIIFIEEEFEYVVGKFVFPFLIRRGRQIIRFFCRFIIWFQFLFESFQRKFIVFEKLFVEIKTCLVFFRGDGIFITVGNAPRLNSLFHFCLIGFVGIIIARNFSDRRKYACKLIDSHLSICGRTLRQLGFRLIAATRKILL